AFGIAQFCVGLTWALQFNVGGYVALCIVEAAFFAAAALLVPGGAGRLPAAAGVFLVAEWARERWPFGGLPLGGIALGQLGGPFAGTARLGGSFLVAGTTFLAGAVVAGAVLGVVVGHRAASPLSWRTGSASRAPIVRSPPRQLATAALGALVVVAVSAWGVFAPAGGSTSPSYLSVAIVQGGGLRGLDQLEVPSRDVLEAAVRETARLERHVDLIVWPEDVVATPGPFFGSADARLLARIARSRRATLVAGVTEPVGATRFRNEIVAFSGKGRVVAVFEKVHRVPFGEYIPFRSFFKHFANLRDVPRDAIAGHGSGMITTPAGRLALLVSYEDFFADRGRSGVRAGGGVIVVPTNTSSYSSDQAPSQEIAASRLQAIEEGRFVLQASPTGYSAVIDNTGTVRQVTALSVPAILTARVPRLAGRTLFERAGPLPVLGAAGLGFVGGWIVFLDTRSGGSGEVRRPRARRRRRRRWGRGRGRRYRFR
ncbi:MAG: apolipoprotein N-acyltransferase, partial [Acidimicrobiales bacterium]